MSEKILEFLVKAIDHHIQLNSPNMILLSPVITRDFSETPKSGYTVLRPNKYSVDVKYEEKTMPNFEDTDLSDLLIKVISEYTELYHARISEETFHEAVNNFINELHEEILGNVLASAERNAGVLKILFQQIADQNELIRSFTLELEKIRSDIQKLSGEK